MDGWMLVALRNPCKRQVRMSEAQDYELLWNGMVDL
jgi:hypothetical protein